jgi:hypothetical protein
MKRRKAAEIDLELKENSAVFVCVFNVIYQLEIAIQGCCPQRVRTWSNQWHQWWVEWQERKQEHGRNGGGFGR